MTDYNDGKWHGWNGGECPVHPESVAQVQRRDETRAQVEEESETKHRKARNWCWKNKRSAGDIIAFRVIKQHREPREVYCTKNGLHNGWATCPVGFPGATLFREVLE